MRPIALLALAAACVLWLPFSASRADALLDGIGNIPGSVEDVRIGGTWERDGTNGAYRVVITRTSGEPVTARLFVQWIVYGETADARVENTIEIREFADLKLDVVNYVSESDDDGLSVYLETIDPNGNSDQSYELHVVSPTDYRFGPATN
jgi:hypothetical protein